MMTAAHLAGADDMSRWFAESVCIMTAAHLAGADGNHGDLLDLCVSLMLTLSGLTAASVLLKLAR